MGFSPGDVLITGGGGQLGRALARELPGATLLRREDIDVTEVDQVRDLFLQRWPKVVIHAAGWAAVDDAELHPEAAWQVNVYGTRVVATAAAEVGALMVFPSTDYVFNGEKQEPYSEDDKPDPTCVYGLTKLAGEEETRACARHLIVRTSWMFGEGNNFVRSAITRARKEGYVEAVDDQIGRPTYARHLAVGMVKLIEKRARGLFHLAAAGEPCSWADLAEYALAQAGPYDSLLRRARLHRISTEEYLTEHGRLFTARRPAYSILDCSKAASLRVRLQPWQQGVTEYVDSLYRLT